MDNKYALYMEVGNMEDINNMSIGEMNSVFRYLNNRDTRMKGGIVPLKDSQREMIKNAKERVK